MKTLSIITLFVSCCFTLSYGQEEKELKGVISTITADSVITISADEGFMPTVGQTVEVYRFFKIFGGDGTMGSADAKVKSVSDSEVKVQVLLYTSTMVQDDGKRVPIIKEGETAKLTWTGEGRTIQNFNSAFKAAQALYEEQKYEAAIVQFSDLVNNFDADWRVFHYRGDCYFKIGENEKAIPDLTKAIEMNDENAQARLLRSFANKKEDHHQAAIDDFNWLLETEGLKESDQVFILKERAFEKKELKDMAGAKADMEAVLKLDANDKVAYNFINQHCGPNGPYDYPDVHAYNMTATVISSSNEGYTTKFKPNKEGIECMFKEDDGVYSTSMEVGAIGTGFTCGASYRMTSCVFEVVSSTKNEVEVKVLFWANSMNNVPSVTKFKAGDLFTFAWN